MKKITLVLSFIFAATSFANESYTCSAGAGYETLYMIRSSVAKSNASDCAKEKCFQAGNRECEIKAVRVDRLVLSNQIYYMATATALGSN